MDNLLKAETSNTRFESSNIPNEEEELDAKYDYDLDFGDEALLTHDEPLIKCDLDEMFVKFFYILVLNGFV